MLDIVPGGREIEIKKTWGQLLGSPQSNMGETMLPVE